MAMDDEIEGKMDQVKGKVKEEVGKATGGPVDRGRRPTGDQFKGQGPKEALGERQRTPLDKGKEAITKS